ncbi:MAG: hypothetical protein Q8Q33_04660 [Chlamydiota bacterium]|nr:hypothetical protein [Chlamydiota bacterium]
MDKLEIYLKDSLGDQFCYPSDAYQFVLDALQYTLKSLDQPRHVSAKELLNGIREYAIKSYGPMTRSVLEHWNISSCEDFGKIVFHLVDARLIAKQESDTRQDFKEGYDFSEVF